MIIRLALFGVYFLFGMLLNSVGIVILQVQDSYGASEVQAATLEAFKDLSIALASFLLAAWVARFGYRRCMMLALTAIGSVCLMMPALPFLWMAKLLFAITGACFALVKISVFASIGLLTRGQKQHTSLMSLLEAVFMTGIIAGHFLFGAFVDGEGGDGWLDTYYALAVLSFTVVALLIPARLDESPARAPTPSTPAAEFVAMLQLALRPLVLVFVICAFLYVLIEQSIMTWLPTFNRTILELPAALSIQMASILAASTALGRLLGALVLRRLEWFPVLAGCLAAAALLVLISMPLAELAGRGMVTGWRNAPLAAWLFPMIGLCLAPVYPAINSVVLAALPRHQHAPMSGLIVVFSALGGTTGSLLTGTLFGAFGGVTAYYGSLVPIAVIVIMLHRLRAATYAPTVPQAA